MAEVKAESNDVSFTLTLSADEARYVYAALNAATPADFVFPGGGDPLYELLAEAADGVGIDLTVPWGRK